jgi:hypothetical protein
MERPKSTLSSEQLDNKIMSIVNSALLERAQRGEKVTADNLALVIYQVAAMAYAEGLKEDAPAD